MVIAGQVLVEFADGQRYELRAGDVVWHESNLAHRWSSLGTETARLMLVNAARRRRVGTPRDLTVTLGDTGPRYRPPISARVSTEFAARIHGDETCRTSGGRSLSHRC